MSRFYASIQGERGEVTRQGHHSITGHVRGWDTGVEVEGRSTDNGEVFEVYATGGSNGAAYRRLVAEVRSRVVTLYGDKGEGIDGWTVE